MIVGRELAVTGLRAVAVSEGIVLAAEELGKYKTIFQMLALHGLLLHYPFFGVDFFTGGMYFLWPSLALSLWSGVDYHVRVIRRAIVPTSPPAQVSDEPPSAVATARKSSASRGQIASMAAACCVTRSAATHLPSPITWRATGTRRSRCRRGSRRRRR